MEMEWVTFDTDYACILLRKQFHTSVKQTYENLRVGVTILLLGGVPVQLNLNSEFV